MADWAAACAARGWKVSKTFVGVGLGPRQHRVRMRQIGTMLELSAEVPDVRDAEELVRMLEENRSLLLAWWHVEGGRAVARSSCRTTATADEMVLRIRETASLADGYELQRHEEDLL